MYNQFKFVIVIRKMTCRGETKQSLAFDRLANNMPFEKEELSRRRCLFVIFACNYS